MLRTSSFLADQAVNTFLASRAAPSVVVALFIFGARLPAQVDDDGYQFFAFDGATFDEPETRVKIATPEAQKELDELVRDFNLLFGGRTKIAIVTNTTLWHQIQTLDGPYEKNPEGD